VGAALKEVEMSMSIAVTAGRAREVSPRAKARLAGISYLLAGTTSAFGEFIVLGRLVVPNEAAATANNILANEPLYWLGFASALLAVACHLAWTALFYGLFRPVNRSLSLLAAFFLVVGCAILGVCAFLQLAPMVVLRGGDYLSVFTVHQLQAQALLFLNLNAQAYNIFLVFFGFYLLVIGYLIFRSTFMPGILGVLYALAGLGYITYLVPPVANDLYPLNLAPAAVGEIALILWLLIVGVNVEQWRKQEQLNSREPGGDS
jgi:Domain of unknown function (DUF4386)